MKSPLEIHVLFGFFFPLAVFPVWFIKLLIFVFDCPRVKSACFTWRSDSFRTSNLIETHQKQLLLRCWGICQLSSVLLNLWLSLTYLVVCNVSLFIVAWFTSLWATTGRTQELFTCYCFQKKKSVRTLIFITVTRGCGLKGGQRETLKGS